MKHEGGKRTKTSKNTVAYTGKDKWKKEENIFFS